MEKFKAFITKYKTPIVFSLCFIFAMTAGFFIQREEIKRENEAGTEAEETRAFITKGNDEPLDKTYKKETVEVMPDERMPKANGSDTGNEIVLPEAFPDSEYEKEPLVTEEALEKSASLPASASSPFSPSMPIKGEKAKPYSVSPIYSHTMDDWRSHEAIDIEAELGTEVTAAEKGTVKFVGKDALLGFLIRISHDGGFETVYANLHGEITVIEGQSVEKGHVIGYAGESALTESADAPHLHFELLKNGKRVNPEEYIR